MRFFSATRTSALLGAALLLSLSAPHVAHADDDKTSTDKPGPVATPADSTTTGTLNAGSIHLDYKAVIGTIAVGSTDADDAMLTADGRRLDGKPHADPDKDPPVAHMSYVAYFKQNAGPNRPITFLYNGGPGSSTIWLHMGSIGPKRVVNADHSATGAPPYKLIDNPDSLLDASDLVFIDMPGTGYGTLTGKDAGKAFWGIDEDGNAFARFIQRFVTKYNRWNSPKYIFGESYGTTRSAVLSNKLENEKNIGLNGVILLSQILFFQTDIDTSTAGNDLPYELALPTYAASAFYHHKLPQQPSAMEPFLKEVETFAMGPYAEALSKGNDLSAADKQAMAEKLHNYTGLPVDYLIRANLRVVGGRFEHTLLGSEETDTGRYDTRFTGPTADPLSDSPGYDPADSAVSNAFVALFNDYAHNTLKYGEDLTFQSSAYAQSGFTWDWSRNGQHVSLPTATEVLSDLASAMKVNPELHVMVNGGYYDLATPFYAAYYEDKHLPIPTKLDANLEFHWYESGHMVYLHEEARKQLHDRVADFIHRTETGGGPAAQ